VADIDLGFLLRRHRELGTAVTLTAVQPGGRYGVVDLNSDMTHITGFREKSKEDTNWINAGFMVMEPEVFDYLDSDSCVLERAPMERLAKEGKLGVHRHYGFWQCMDTLRDKTLLEELLKTGEAPWRVWQ
jgi:glucose-1-phosphate cytidylyltransferase